MVINTLPYPPPPTNQWPPMREDPGNWQAVLIFVSKLFMTNKVSLFNRRHCYMQKNLRWKVFTEFFYILIMFWFFYRYFAQEIDLSGLQVDMGLRKFQSLFRMPVSSLLLFIDTNRETLVYIPPSPFQKEGGGGERNKSKSSWNLYRAPSVYKINSRNLTE